MTETIPEMKAKQAQREAEMLRVWHAELDEIKAHAEPDAGPYLDRLSHEQRGEILREQKEDRLDRQRDVVLEEYTSTFDDFREAHDRRAKWLDKRLYHVEGPGAGAMVSGAVTASDEDLARMLEGAIRTNNAELGKVVFG